MKILLIGEASGVHRNLKKGLFELGYNPQHFVLYQNQQDRKSDGSFSPVHDGILGGVLRNISPIKKSLQLEEFDVINFINTITAVHGRYTKYFDIPLIRRKTKLMSYYAVGCDEIGLIRRSNVALEYSPCRTCISSGEQLGKDCENNLNKIYEKSQERVKKYFDVAACSMIEYEHVSVCFDDDKFARIPLPIDVAEIPFSPARNHKKIKIVHTPTRRGFKGTQVVSEAIEFLREVRQDFDFVMIEGLSYKEYLKEMSDADIVIDQVYGQSPGVNALEMLAAGKIVLTGATEMGKSYFDFMGEFPGFNASPDPKELSLTINAILDQRQRFGEMALIGRDYLEKKHSCVEVAKSFVNLWRANMG